MEMSGFWQPWRGICRALVQRVLPIKFNSRSLNNRIHSTPMMMSVQNVEFADTHHMQLSLAENKNILRIRLTSAIILLIMTVSDCCYSVAVGEHILLVKSIKGIRVPPCRM